ncbi:holin [Streptomyces samsunensis]|uniref:holin n=1 Tax=Streptomyces malaysiensis TaxID=92644 RepID=UPI0015831619|nr:holin [Streptomyces samsunensis]NUH35253.1 holin [Streptomyces samsunensis]
MSQSPPVEAKVKAATTATLLVSLVLAVLNDVRDDASLLAPLPGWLQAIVIALVPPAITFFSGWQARHTSRISQ